MTLNKLFNVPRLGLWHGVPHHVRPWPSSSPMGPRKVGYGIVLLLTRLWLWLPSSSTQFTTQTLILLAKKNVNFFIQKKSTPAAYVVPLLTSSLFITHLHLQQVGRSENASCSCYFISSAYAVDFAKLVFCGWACMPPACKYKWLWRLLQVSVRRPSVELVNRRHARPHHGVVRGVGGKCSCSGAY